MENAFTKPYESQLPASHWTMDKPLYDWKSSSTGDSSGGGFSGAFSKNFGSNFLDMWKNRNAGGGSSTGGSAFSPGTAGGGSIAPIGDKGKHFLFQYTNPQPIIQQNAPSGPGFGEQLAQTAIGAGISAGIGALCDIRTKVDIAPLESTEVNDSLAEIAFFVKGLRECA